jgi:uncharacterized protein involved in cysteine biosynthesis
MTITVDARQVTAMLDRLGPVAEYFVRMNAKETAERIVSQATSRVARLTGETSRRIDYALLRRGIGYAVVQEPVSTKKRKVPRFLEHGTRYMVAQPYFDVSADAERAGHEARLAEALQRALDSLGR